MLQRSETRALSRGEIERSSHGGIVQAAGVLAFSAAGRWNTSGDRAGIIVRRA